MAWQAYTLFVLFLTAVWVYALRRSPFSLLCLAMYFPSLSLLPFLLSFRSDDVAVFLARLCDFSFRTVVCTLIGVTMDLAIVFGALVLSICVGWAHSRSLTHSLLSRSLSPPPPLARYSLFHRSLIFCMRF